MLSAVFLSGVSTAAFIPIHSLKLRAGRQIGDERVRSRLTSAAFNY
jgi:hypothetical protein